MVSGGFKGYMASDVFVGTYDGRVRCGEIGSFMAFLTEP